MHNLISKAVFEHIWLIQFKQGQLWPCCILTTGMVDIARQTVEFLYEENGGIPRDLYLPTIEDIKDEANKFTIDKVRKGTIHLLYTQNWAHSRVYLHYCCV